MKILLIDDDKDDQELFCEAAKRILPGVELELANEGYHGLNLLKATKELPAMVFLDINMPLFDGRETLAAIRSTSSLRDLPVIMYSTSIESEEKARFARLKATCMIKPNSFDELVDMLREEFSTRLSKDDQTNMNR